MHHPAKVHQNQSIVTQQGAFKIKISISIRLISNFSNITTADEEAEMYALDSLAAKGILLYVLYSQEMFAKSFKYNSVWCLISR